MSLFPAYGNVDPSINQDQETSSAQENYNGKGYNVKCIDWLTNSSFIPLPTSKVIYSTVSSSTEDEEVKHHKRKKKKAKRRKRKKSDDSSSSSGLIVIDKTIEKVKIFPVDKIAASKKIKKNKSLKKKKRSKERYFSKAKKDEGGSNNEAGAQSTKLGMEEFLKMTESYNISLRENPNDIATWLQYIKLQDQGEGSIKGIAEKKLAIIEKALSSNPMCEMLVNEKFSVSEKILSTDKLASEAKALVGRDSSSMVGWNWLIRCNQFTLSRMTVPCVLETYASALKGFYRMDRDTKKMIEMVLHCGLFLRQAGLWEYLWAFLEHYLELNLADPGSQAFKIKVEPPEEQIREIEDTIVTCGLPLGSLWLRIELLREAVHFLPADSSEDPQRAVFPEDTSDLVFPVKKAVTPRLIGVALVLLKVPPLPTTDSFTEFVGLKSTPWAYDTTEYILAAIHRSGIVEMDTKYITIAKELVIGPQYVNERLGEKEFFNFVDAVFESCGKCAGAEEKEAIFVWQLRWWRMVARLRGKESKELRSKVKKLLKESRDCIPLYTEYALLEFDCGDAEAALRVSETAVSLSSPPLTVVRDRAQIAHLYRTHIEILLAKDFTANRERALRALIALAFGRRLSDVGVSGSEESLSKARERFKHLTQEILSDVDVGQEVSLGSLLVPEFSVSWLASHAWLLYLTKGVWESVAVVEGAIAGIPAPSPNTLGHCLVENYYEILVNVLHHFCVNNAGHYKVLEEVLDRSRILFPDNLHFLNVSASTKMDTSSSKNVENTNPSFLAHIFEIFVYRDKMMKKESQEPGTAKSSGLHKKMYYLLRKLSMDPKTESCPLVWRLILQFIALESPADIKKLFFQAVEKCPWVKSIYYSAAQTLPEDLGQIQDLLVEKELRLHITPEEIEILRENDK